MLARTVQTGHIKPGQPGPTRNQTNHTLLIRAEQRAHRQPRQLDRVVDVDLHRLVAPLLAVVPEVRPRRLEDARARHVDVRHGAEVLHRRRAERREVGPRRHVALLELDRRRGRDERVGFGREFQVADEDARAAPVREFGERETDPWWVC